MSSTFEFFNNPIMPGQPPQYMSQNVAPVQQQYPAQVYNPAPPTPTISSSGSGLGLGFKIVPDEASENLGMMVPNHIDVPATTTPKKKGRPRKVEAGTETGDIIRADGVIEDQSAAYTYSQTTMMLQETVQQIDMLASEIKEELDNVRLSRTMRNKHNTMVGLASSLGKILETKVSAISQINNSISKANDLDYKREKDRKASEANAAADDRYIMDMYNAFIKNPMQNAPGANILGPSMLDTTIIGGSNPQSTGIIRSDIGTMPENGIRDNGYLNYLSNLTPEQNMMFYEANPNVKTVVVYDAATGNKFFQVMDVSTGQVIPNVPVMDNRFMEDTFLDLKNKIAKNNNLHESYPIVVINEGITREY